MLTIHVEKRSVSGKRACGRLRKQNIIPAVVYNSNKQLFVVQMQRSVLASVLNKAQLPAQKISLEFPDKTLVTLIKDIQWHAYKKQVLHVDFIHVQDEDQVRLTMPIHYVGVEIAPGIKRDKGSMLHPLTHVKISCKLKDLPERIEIDVSHLGVGQSMQVSEIKNPGIRILSQPTQVIATIKAPKVHAEKE